MAAQAGRLIEHQIPLGAEVKTLCAFFNLPGTSQRECAGKTPGIRRQPTTKKTKMKNITVKYGVDQITKQVEAGFSFGDLQNSDKSILGK